MSTNPARAAMLERNQKRASVSTSTAREEAQKEIALGLVYLQQYDRAQAARKNAPEASFGDRFVAAYFDKVNAPQTPAERVEAQGKLQEQAKANRRMSAAYGSVQAAIEELEEAIGKRDSGIAAIERSTLKLAKARANLASVTSNFSSVA